MANTINVDGDGQLGISGNGTVFPVCGYKVLVS
jgi:hypothetical protein